MVCFRHYTTFYRCIVFSFTPSGVKHFEEISVERINILEKEGKLRMVLSNKSRSPEFLAYGKGLTPPIPGGLRPRLIFLMMRVRRMAG